MIQARRQHDAFGLGSFTDLGGSNPSVLSYAREHVTDDGSSEIIVCVNNLSRFPQPVELDLRRFEGMRARSSCSAACRSRAIGELPYLLTLGGYGFYWFRLTAARRPRGGPAPVTDAATSTPRCSRTTSTGPAGSAARAAPSPSPTCARSASCRGGPPAGR